MAEEILRCHCSVAVQVDGKSLHQKKFSKDFGLRAVRLVSGVVVQVLGFKHEIRLTGHNFHSASKETIPAGRLLIRTKDNMMIMLTDAQPGQLQEIAKLLSGTTRPVATPGKNLKRLQAPRQAVLEIKRHKGQEASLPAASSTATVELNQVCWHLVLQFVSQDAGPYRQFLSEVCQDFKQVLRPGGGSLRIKTAMAQSVTAESLLQGIRERSRIELLDLSGFPKITAKFCKDLAAQCLSHLRHLSFRGCRGLTDLGLRNVLQQLPQLRHLDLLEIPSLSNRALEVEMPELESLLLGSLGRKGTAEAALTSHSKSARLDVHGEVKETTRVMDRPAFNSRFTSQVLQQLLMPEHYGCGKPGKPALQPSPLSLVVLSHCDIQVFPRLCASLRHLDLAGAKLQLPRAAEESWQPLKQCHQLKVLGLSGTELSPGALRSCLSSLPSQLQALDLGDTVTDVHVVRTVIERQQRLTHFRLCRCIAIENLLLNRILQQILTLEVVDVTGCQQLTLPIDIPGTSNLRTLCVAQTNLNPADLRLENSTAEVIPCRLDFFGSYSQLPPRLP